MAVRLRLRRMGKKKQPMYKIVAADSRSPRDGRFIETLGTYNPLSEPASITVDVDRTLYWLSKGAIPTDTVRSLLKQKGVWLRWSLMRRGVHEEIIADEVEKWNLLQAEKLRRKAERKARRAAKKAEKFSAPSTAEGPLEATSSESAGGGEEAPQQK